LTRSKFGSLTAFASLQSGTRFRDLRPEIFFSEGIPTFALLTIRNRIESWQLSKSTSLFSSYRPFQFALA
jgi:hypothetical protein